MPLNVSNRFFFALDVTNTGFFVSWRSRMALVYHTKTGMVVAEADNGSGKGGGSFLENST